MVPEQERQSRVVSVREAAKILGIGRDSAYAAARKGEIPTIRIGRRLLVPIDALERMLQGQVNSPCTNEFPGKFAPL